MSARTTLFITTLVLLAGCGGGGGDEAPSGGGGSGGGGNTLDADLRQIINTLGLTGDPSTGRNLPSINDPIAQLGKKLFFSKSLSGDADTACASCHHPALGGGDHLSLPVGTGAQNPDLLGPGRTHTGGVPIVGRNAPTVFNIGMYDSGLFWDSRIESIGKEAGRNGAGSGIRTPDTALNVEDPDAGSTLPAAQARFPVAQVPEMRGATFEAGGDNDAVRGHLAARLGNYGAGVGELNPNDWLNEFQMAFASAEPADQLVTYENIARALGEYQRSMVFVDNAWRAYVQGDDTAISDQAKRGALIFFRSPAEGGAGCAECHSGDFFTNEEHHTIGFPQIGPGKGDGNSDDFGRERETGDQRDRYRFRTPNLLNVEVTFPYTHSGAYRSLGDVLGHYVIPRDIVDNFFNAGGWCSLSQFTGLANCQSLYPDSQTNTLAALAKVTDEQRSDPSATFPVINIPPSREAQFLAFLNSLTDPCVKDRACLAPWIPEPNEAPDGNQLNAVDNNGDPL